MFSLSPIRSARFISHIVLNSISIFIAYTYVPFRSSSCLCWIVSLAAWFFLLHLADFKPIFYPVVTASTEYVVQRLRKIFNTYWRSPLPSFPLFLRKVPGEMMYWCPPQSGPQQWSQGVHSALDQWRLHASLPASCKHLHILHITKHE